MVVAQHSEVGTWYPCAECGGAPVLTTGQEIYPHRPDLFVKHFWICRPCAAWVGCHGQSGNALGMPAGPLTRTARSMAHAAFDPIWKSGQLSRISAYRWLAGRLGIHVKDCHISWFNADECAKVVEVSKRYPYDD